MHFTIVSYTFPPSKEIGGRRWAKFSLQLAKLGHEVTVICANNFVSDDWYKKEFPGIEFKLLPKCYPEWLTGYTESIGDKLLYAFYTRIMNFFTNKNLFDKGYAWRKPMLKALELLHFNKPIDVLVVTGGPFSLLDYGAEFKKQHKEIQYVADLRDPWTWGNLYSIPEMSALKKKYQEKQEYNTIESCDMMCYPVQNMGDFIKNKYPSFSSKLYLLPHAFEPDKFPTGIKKDFKRKGFIYGGTIYTGIEGYIKTLSEILKEHPDSQFKWDIYTSTHYPLIDSNFANGKIQKHPLISEEELFIRINNAAAYLAFFSETGKDLISTKFFEIIYTSTPILYIGEEGAVGRFIRENRLGVHILPENMERDFPKYINGNVPFEKNYFDISIYTFSSVTKDFLEALKDFRGSS